MDNTYRVTDRRPLKSRDRKTMQWLATRLANSGVSPNLISIAGMIACITSGAALFETAHAPSAMRWALWLVAAAGMQLRLLANLLDGMVAVARQTASAMGELFNEVPDRISDAAVFIGAGYAIGSIPALGYLAACGAIFGAYVRAMGKIATGKQDYGGPMAKPQRMFVMTIAALCCAMVPSAWQSVRSGVWGIMAYTLGIILAGTLLTVWRRLIRIAAFLRGSSC